VYTAVKLIEGELQEPRYVWRLGATEKSCVDCLFWNGKTLTASDWRRTGIAPNSPDLACNGYRCRCVLLETDEPGLGFANVQL